MSYLESLLERRAELRSSALKYLETAETEQRELNDAENTSIEDIDRQVETLDTRIKPLQDAELRDAEHAKRQALVDRAAARPKDSTPKADPGDGLPGGDDAVKAMYRSGGQWIADWTAWKKNDDSQAKQRLYRAIQHQTTTDNPGLLPVPILGPAVSILNTTRPAITAVGPRAMPAKGKSFQRPVVTQHTITGVQTTEKTALPSQKLTVNPQTVTKATYGGVVNISMQDIEWTEPSVWDMVINDMFGQLAKNSETAFGTALTAATTTKTTLAAGATAAATITAIYTGASTVYTAVGEMPDTIFMAVDVWAKLGGLGDTTGRPIFPTLGPNNAAGQLSADSLTGSILGFRAVVSPGLAPGTFILGCSRYAEWYENGPGQVSVSEPELLGVQVAVYQYAAMLFPTPTAFTYFAP